MKVEIKHLGICSGLLLLLLQIAAAPPVGAAGFAIIEQSVRGLGSAYAGSAALAEDASTIFYNPAGMTYLSGQHLEVGAHYIVPRARFSDQGSTLSPELPAPIGGLPLSGDNGGDGGESAFVPNLYYALSLNEDLTVGLGLSAPFGLTTKYTRTWVGRYHGVESNLKTLNINPALAYRVHPKLSLGAGFSIQRAEATLGNAVDFGTIFAASLGTSPQGADGYAEVTGDDWGYGFNLGLIYTPLESTRIGLAYRSQIRHRLEGEAEFEYPNETVGAAAAAPGVRLVDGDAKADVDLPATLALSAVYEIGPRWALLADVTWTQWSQIEELRIRFDSGAADSVTTLDWEDTWRYAVGALFKPDERWHLRAGLAFDQSPVPDSNRRTPRIPDDDRVWTAIGSGYRINQMIDLNLSYAHLFIKDPKIDKDGDEAEDRLRGALTGEYEASVDIVSINLEIQF
ncbi:MAG: outer membrane protein transport protein [Desulfosarcinaceae bacterium]|nr:outer membrane protein transport protein [Desulfosarcinaceae bacterium]